jgi:hypothetical protein
MSRRFTSPHGPSGSCHFHRDISYEEVGFFDPELNHMFAVPEFEQLMQPD